MSSSFRSAKKDDDDVESLVGTTKYAGGAGLQKWDKAVLVDLGTGEQPWLKEVYMGELYRRRQPTRKRRLRRRRSGSSARCMK